MTELTDPVRTSDDPNEKRIQTSSGIYYNYTNPDASMILLEDIAHQLAGTFRFSAATDPWISVAEHSVLVSRLCPVKKSAGLMHDGAEAYLWDIPKPAKPLYGTIYSELTALCDVAIGERFGIDIADFDCKEVKDADWIMLNYEGNEGLPHWSEPKPELPYGVLDWELGLPPAAAKKLFLQEAARVGLSSKVDYSAPMPSLHTARSGFPSG